ncbi:hypothetical protein [Pleionea litopenaei]|uniref:Lipoprotein n=1 Tax=Pleionea litopenaei TaxID=3070815 RepID=A0AA51RS43_9GAMM|nr:hypothetical protein [Pleionea sp. HL-JVS1]WMS86581.1 hypothetical protein Q9312_15275 [Pleionea sp. HL-JVS1]
MKPFTSIVLIFLSKLALSCSCWPEAFDLEKAFQIHQSVAIVEVVSVTNGKGSRELFKYNEETNSYSHRVLEEHVTGYAEAKIVNLLKGSPSKLVKINAGEINTSCSVELEVGEQYLAFLEHNEAKVGFCNPSGHVESFGIKQFLQKNMNHQSQQEN